MSGSGGSAYDPTPPQKPCDRLNFKTVLNSPDPAVIGRLHGDEKLQIELETVGGRRRAVAKHDGHIAGSITSDMLPQLIRCLEQGNPFHADVLTVSGGRVEVDVHPGA